LDVVKFLIAEKAFREMIFHKRICTKAFFYKKELEKHFGKTIYEKSIYVNDFTR